MLPLYTATWTAFYPFELAARLLSPEQLSSMLTICLLIIINIKNLTSILLSSVNCKMQKVVPFVVDSKVDVVFFKTTKINKEHNIAIIDSFENLELHRCQLLRNYLLGSL